MFRLLAPPLWGGWEGFVEAGWGLWRLGGVCGGREKYLSIPLVSSLLPHFVYKLKNFPTKMFQFDI